MKITIGHLYHDILNLYGESGNILALKYALEKQGVEVVVKELTITDELDFSSLDFVYMGCGTEKNQLIALEHLKKYASIISQSILSNKMFLVTGNSIELFGSHITNCDKDIETLGIFNYYTEKTNNRLVAECVFKNDKINDLILGFENHQGITKNVDTSLFTVIKGYGDSQDQGHEGYKHNRFYGTYLLGPILARNPFLLEHLVKKLITSKDKDFIFKPFELDIQQMAHDKFIEKYTDIIK